MKTKPLYLEGPYLQEMKAVILDAILESDGVYRLILDQTVFYPMGGGQPTDQGKLLFSDGSQAEVYQVLLKEGEINHFVKTDLKLEPQMDVKGVIDWDRRFKNMRVHSAAHVIDFSLFLLGFSPKPLYPMKGDHGKKPFILYQGVLDQDIKEDLQSKTDELIAKEMNFSWRFDLLENIEKNALYLQPGLPKNKPLRALTLEGVGTVADGGTIVSNTKEVGKVIITAIETSEGNTLIKYAI